MHPQSLDPCTPAGAGRVREGSCIRQALAIRKRLLSVQRWDDSRRHYRRRRAVAGGSSVDVSRLRWRHNERFGHHDTSQHPIPEQHRILHPGPSLPRNTSTFSTFTNVCSRIQHKLIEGKGSRNPKAPCAVSSRPHCENGSEFPEPNQHHRRLPGEI